MALLDQESERLRRVFSAYAEAGLPKSRWSLANRGNLKIHQEISQTLVKMLTRNNLMPLDNKRILEVGCGDGRVLQGLISMGAKSHFVSGVDMLDERINSARCVLPEVDLRVADARFLPFPPESFDIVVTFTLFSSILQTQFARQVATEMCRVLKPGGAAVYYDFQYDNPRNPNVRGIKRAEVEQYFEDFQPSWKRLTLFPPLARRLGIFTPIAYPLLAAVPFLRTHLMGVLIKPDQRKVESRK